MVYIYNIYIYIDMSLKSASNKFKIQYNWFKATIDGQTVLFYGYLFSVA